MNLQNQIDEIGQRLVACEMHCKGIAPDPGNGIIPRCLFLETGGRWSGQGCIIVGINPGPSGRREREYYVTKGGTYSAMTRYLVRHIKDVPYYKRLRRLADELGFGSILWTESVHCEMPEGVTRLWLKTRRTCAAQFLKRGLSAVPPDWLVIAAGRDTYQSLAFLDPLRPLIGVPHPTARYTRRQFGGLFDSSGELRSHPKSQVTELLNGSPSRMEWLKAG